MYFVYAILFNVYINDFLGRLLGDTRSSDTINDRPYLNDIKINDILFADDLANFFSLSKEDLQKRRSILERYSNESR